jgi:GntR family transcriptional regulator, arabinose operon transcriptional repressor
VQDVKRPYNSKALRLSEHLYNDICSGQYQPGEFLPPETSLADHYGVSRETIRRAVGILTGKKHLVKLPQRGVLVPSGSGESLVTAVPEPADPSALNPIPVSLKTIGAVWAAEPDAHLVGIGEGIASYCREHHLDFQVLPSTKGHAGAIEILRHIDDYDLDGLIVLPYPDPAYVLTIRELVERGFPIVGVDRTLNDFPLNSLEVDNAGGEYSATEYLIRKYRRPVYFLSFPLESQTIRDRYEGYKRAMEEAGFEEWIGRNKLLFDRSESDPEFWPVDKKWIPGRELACRMIQESPGPWSVVCLNDSFAKGVYKAVRHSELKIGEDIRVVGFDDTPLASLLKPTLTTVRQPRTKIGYQAANLLHRLMMGKVKKTTSIHLPVELVVRESA